MTGVSITELRQLPSLSAILYIIKGYHDRICDDLESYAKLACMVRVTMYSNETVTPLDLFDRNPKETIDKALADLEESRVEFRKYHKEVY